MDPGPGVRLLLDTQDEAFHWTAPKIVLSVFLFLAAGVCEIGGGWLIWHSLRGKLLPEPQRWWQSPKAYLYVVAGGVTLVGYGYDPPLLARHTGIFTLAARSAQYSLSLLLKHEDHVAVSYLSPGLPCSSDSHSYIFHVTQEF